MQTVKLTNTITYVGALDKQLRVFDIIMHTPYGTTYNSYIIKGGQKTALVETVKDRFFDELEEKVGEAGGFGSIDYLIMNHTEPDHAGSVKRVLEKNPDITVVGSMGAINFLGQIVNAPFKSRVVKTGDELDLGGRTLTFFLMPNLHWPDTMFTFVREEGVLLTCDCFGSHFCHEGILRSTVVDEAGYLEAAKYYFDNILGPFKKPFVRNAIGKVRELGVKMICPGHGPVLDTGIEAWMDTYSAWCEGPKKEDGPYCVIAYVSAYGYTRRLADEIGRELQSQGVKAALYEITGADPAGLMEEIQRADGLLLGSPTILGDALKPVWDLLSFMPAAVYGGKQAAAFGSYGWSGEAVGYLTARLEQLKMKTMPGYCVRFAPGEEDLAGARAFAGEFAARLTGK